MLLKTLILILCISAAAATRWIDVPFVAQQKDGCGAAAAAMVLLYWGLEANPDAILAEIYSKRDRGIRARDLEAYLRSRGMKVFAIAGELADLDRHIAAGRPLIVSLGGSPLHYVVVTGIDAENGQVLVNDPADRKLRRIAQREFDSSWKNAGRWMLLAVPNPSR